MCTFLCSTFSLMSQQILHQETRNLVGAASGHPQCYWDALMAAHELSWDSDWVQTLSPPKRSFLTLFFHKLAKRVDTTNVTAGKIESMYCPTGHSTATSPQLAVPVSYKALSVLQFGLFSAYSALSNVKTSEIFSQCWLALGSSKFLDKR